MPNKISARDVAVSVLVRVARDGAFAAAALDAELERTVQIDSRDKGLATELVYGTLRVMPWLEERLDAYATRGVSKLEPRVRAHLDIAAYQLFFLHRVPAFAAVNECVNAVRNIAEPRVASFANAVLRKVSIEAASANANGTEHQRLHNALVRSAAPWLCKALNESLGEKDAELFLASGAEVPPIGLRVDDTSENARDAWLERLRTAAPEATFVAGRVSPRAILVRNLDMSSSRLSELPGWNSTWIVQEEGAQAIALALEARAGDHVLDACSGRGNKTSYLVRAVGESGAVDAADLHASKNDRLLKELARLSLRPRKVYAVDWSVGSGDITSKYDRVLVDAPCSGVGTLRRRPEITTRNATNVKELSELQKKILIRVSDHVKSGGRLVYAVCSVLRDECENVVDEFLSARSNFKLIKSERLLPQVHGTDGYFIATFDAVGTS